MRWPSLKTLWIVSIVLSILLAWTGRYYVNPDGVSYLDLSDDFRAGRWSSAVSGHWSPAYPFVLSLWLGLVDPGPRLESLAVHALNAIIFVSALAAFTFFLRELRRTQMPREGRTIRPWILDLGKRSAVTSAWSIFAWCTLVLISIKVVTPDMMVAAIVFAIAGVVLRIREEDAGTGSFVLLGALLGLGYLAKSFMFWVAFAFLAISFATTRRVRHSARSHLVSLVVYALVALPQVLALSREAGHLRISDSGRIVYALQVNHVPKLWTGSPPANGTPANPVEVISERPLVIGFPTAAANHAYPLWDDPSYWYTGMAARFDASEQLRAVTSNLKTDAELALKIVLPLLLLWLLRDRRFPTRYRSLTLLPWAVIAAYALLYSEGRLIAPWIAVGVISGLAGMSLPADASRAKIASGMVHVIALISVISVATYALDQSFSRKLDRGLFAENLQWRVATMLREAGVTPGSRVGLVGDETAIYWARLSGVQIAIQIPFSSAAEYWNMTSRARTDLDRRIRAGGAVAIVASWTAPPRTSTGWTRVPGTRYSIHPLN